MQHSFISLPDECRETSALPPGETLLCGRVRRKEGEKRVGGGDEGRGRMTCRHTGTSDVGNIECGNEMFIRCGFEGAAGGAGAPGEGCHKH